jgi:ferrochelatase
MKRVSDEFNFLFFERRNDPRNYTNPVTRNNTKPIPFRVSSCDRVRVIPWTVTLVFGRSISILHDLLGTLLMPEPYDALLIVSFGGPEGVADVIPFLQNVLRGRNVSPERMHAVAEHYYSFGGVSPLNEHNRRLIKALKKELEVNGPRLPIYWGNRNWHPLLSDTIHQMYDDGIKHALAFVTAAYSSYSSCRQYLENIASAQEDIEVGKLRIDKIRPFFNHPLFVQANAEQLSKALAQLPESQRTDAQLVFTAHSIPLAMAQNCRYEAQLLETARLVSAAAGHSKWSIVFQSRSGSPAEPWLGPVLSEYLESLRGTDNSNVVIAPIGFVSDHMEVVYDLDVRAKNLCAELELNLIRVRTAGTHPAFVAMIRELIIERINGQDNRQFLGDLGAAPDVCALDCCLK